VGGPIGRRVVSRDFHAAGAYGYERRGKDVGLAGVLSRRRSAGRGGTSVYGSRGIIVA
jgi:hypothetical protein